MRLLEEVGLRPLTKVLRRIQELDMILIQMLILVRSGYHTEEV